MSRRNLSRALPFLFVLALLVAGCASAQPTPTALAPIPLKLVVLPFLPHAPFHIGLAEGYFAEQGLDVEPVQLQLAQDANSLLAQGQVDVLGGFVTAGVLNAIARGANIKIVADRSHAAKTDCTPIAWVARSSLIEDGVLTDVASLRGMKIITEAPNLMGFLTEKLLRTANLTLDDIEPVVMYSSEFLGALQQGSVDLLGPTAEPWLTIPVQAGVGQVWAPVHEYAPNCQYSTVMYGPTLLGENKDAGRRFMVAYLKAVRQYNEGKTERNLDILTEALGLERELLEQACWPPIRSDGAVNVESLVEYADWAVEKGFADSKLTADQLYDPSFIEYANQVLGPAQ